MPPLSPGDPAPGLWAEIATLWLFGIAVSASPGPNNTLLAALATRHGFRRTLPAMAGVLLGAQSLIYAAAFGLAGLVLVVPGLEAGLRWAGFAFLLFLAWRIATAALPDEGVAAAGARPPVGFLEGFILQPLNPKLWIYAISAMATFGGGADHLSKQAAATLLILPNLTAALAWMLAGAGLQRLIAGNPRRHRIVAVLLGIVTALTALMLVI